MYDTYHATRQRMVYTDICMSVLYMDESSAAEMSRRAGNRRCDTHCVKAKDYYWLLFYIHTVFFPLFFLSSGCNSRQGVLNQKEHQSR